ncbi:hypothetical protein [Paenibacillus sp. SYP-B4298]|uniref:hypothetical protein n=1 Tax=Paenibacillus sp. SYP-B4298 TaxID=2996034 RepID=UPI0022DCE578|nr:hypothetical protein [Paenibacillus sp. SYP-B4298]
MDGIRHSPVKGMGSSAGLELPWGAFGGIGITYYFTAVVRCLEGDMELREG